MSGSARPRKHSLTLQGHRTSVSLEDAFWSEVQRLAEVEGKSVNELIAEIDAGRGTKSGLASAIRVYVLERLKAGH
ncbi:aryl-sulfate sulfotransferase [Rhodobacterales bacterium HKCCSP123]|nr:aryl-sulfate sulfotransferase [Rhodobacterales bacterium HKCCSP123]